MKSQSSTSSILTFNFCYDSQAHPDCIQQSKPYHVTGFKPRNRVEKILRKFCKKSKLDQSQIQDLELHRCFCIGQHEDDEESLLDSGMRIGRTALEEGNRVFVRRIGRTEEDQDGSDSIPDSNRMRSPSENSRGSTVLKVEGRAAARVASNRKQTIELLEGDSFFAQSGLTLPVLREAGSVYWEDLARSVKIAVRMTPTSQRTGNGHFPPILVNSLNRCIKDRLSKSSSKSQYFNQIIKIDLKAAIKLMHSQAMLDMGKQDPLFAGSEEVDEEPLPETIKDYEKRLISSLQKISNLWQNTSWKKQRLRSDLGPISLSNLRILRPLESLAELTSVDESDSTNSGFPSLVLQALREALCQDEIMMNEGKFKSNVPSSGWAQQRVITAALPILRAKLAAEEDEEDEIEEIAGGQGDDEENEHPPSRHSSPSQRADSETSVSISERQHQADLSLRNSLRKQTSDLLGGELYRMEGGFDLPFSGTVGTEYWKSILESVKLALKMTPRFEREGMFPSILIESVNQCIEERRSRDGGNFFGRVIRRDFEAAIGMMQAQELATIDGNEPFEQSDQEMDEEDEIERTSPIAITNSNSSIQSQLAALKANKKRKLDDPSSTEQEKRKAKKQYKRKSKELIWKSKDIEFAPIIQLGSPPPIASSTRVQLDSPTPSSSLQALSSSKFKIEFILSDLKTAMKLKSRHPSITAKQKKEGKKLYKRMKRFLKRK